MGGRREVVPHQGASLDPGTESTRVVGGTGGGGAGQGPCLKSKS